MASRSFFRRIARRFFFPLKLKLPLELVTAAAVGVVLFFIIKPQQTIRPVMAPTPADLSEETRQVPALLRAMRVKEADQGAAVVTGPAPPEIFDEVEEPLEIVVRMKPQAPFAEKGFNEKTLTSDQPPVQPDPQTAFEKSSQGPASPVRKKAVPGFTVGKTGEGDAEKRSRDLFQERKSVEDRILRYIAEVGGRVIESLENEKEATLVCSVPKDAVGKMQGILESFGTIISFPQKPFQGIGDPIEIRIRIVF